MGLLGHLGMKAEQKRLRPFFRNDEHFMETDVCELVSTSEGHFAAQVALSFTNRAIYFRQTKGFNGDVVRIPYECVLGTQQSGSLFEFRTFKSAYLFKELGRPMGSDKRELLSLQIGKIERFHDEVEVPNGTVEVINRPTDEGQQPGWLYLPSENVDLKDPAVRESLRSQLTSAIDQYGPLFKEGN